MKNLKLFLCANLVAFTINAQLPNHQWTKTFDGGSSAKGLGITADGDGNVYAVGVFGTTTDFDNSAATYNLTSNGALDTYLTKSTSEGNLIWAKNFGGISDDVPSEVAVNQDGNIYITGTFKGTADFDPNAGTLNLTSAGQEDVFILKVLSDGSLSWAKRIGGAEMDYGNAIAVDEFDGSVFVVGTYRSTVDFNPGAGIQNATSIGSGDAYLLKLSASGDYVNSKVFGGIASDEASDIVIDQTTGDQFITGNFNGTVDFDPGAAVVEITGTNDIFVLKLNEPNNFVFAKTMGGIAVDEGRNIDIDANGFIYVHGSFIFECNFNTSGGETIITSNGSDDVFVVQLSPTGNLNWVKTFGSTGTEDYMDMEVTANGKIYLTGEMAATMDANPDAVGVQTLTKLGAEDTYIISLESTGAFDWATSYGAVNIGAYTRSFGIFADNFDNVYITGSFQNTVDFDPSASTLSVSAASGLDIWYQKLGPGTNGLEENVVPNLSVSPNPSQGIFKLDGSTFKEIGTITVSNLLGESVYQKELDQSAVYEINLENNLSGVYIILVETISNRQTLKIVKN